MRTLHQTLHLQHHEHTGRVLHHKHTSYRSLVVIFVIAGAFMVGLNAISRVAADDFGVSGTVEAPIPASAPIISSPAADSNVSGTSALVTGSCPMVTPQAVVGISVDGTASGTGACDTNNDFSVPVTLTSGSHKLTATALTVTGQTGPTSSPEQVQVKGGSTAAGVTISSQQPFVYADARDITWTGTIGGTPGTDFVHIDWGDNSQSNLSVQPGAQTFSHRYASLASHNILFAVSNKAGGSVSEQFASSAFTSYVAPVAVSSTETPFTPTIIGLYGLYVTALAVTGIIWLEAKHAARQHIQLHTA